MGRKGTISKITNPVEKKAIAYGKDHRYPAKYVHAFRHNWPRKKARANRKYRRKVQQFLKDKEESIVEGAELSNPPVRRSTVRKWIAVPLGEWVTQKQEMRLKRTAWNFFKIPYHRTWHQEGFSAFLTTVTQGHTAASQQLASRFAELLDPPDPHKPRAIRSGHYEVGPRAWLAAFLADMPEWDQPLRGWIERTTASDDTS